MPSLEAAEGEDEMDDEAEEGEEECLDYDEVMPLEPYSDEVQALQCPMDEEGTKLLPENEKKDDPAKDGALVTWEPPQKIRRLDPLPDHGHTPPSDGKSKAQILEAEQAGKPEVPATPSPPKPASDLAF